VCLRVFEAEMLQMNNIILIWDHNPPPFHFQEWVFDGITKITFSIWFNVNNNFNIIHRRNIFVSCRMDYHVQLFNPRYVGNHVFDIFYSIRR
jgi:hypothetical protein